MTEKLEEYILQHIDKEPAHLAKLDRDTHLYHLYSRMCSGHLQGRMLKMFVRMINPVNVLELGTFTGYSAQCLAEGLLSNEAHIHTIEIDDELEDFIRNNFEKSPVGDKITLHIGDAKQVLNSELKDMKFDLAFIDANKREYVEYFNLVLPCVSKGGFIIADNTLWDGKVVDWGSKLDAQTEGVLKFNELVANDDRVETVILPIRDGLTLLYKK